MMKPRKLPLVFALVGFTVFGAEELSAQTQRTCGTMDHWSQLVARDPKLALRQQTIESNTQSFISAGAPGVDSVIRIPIVVHVVYNTTAQNIGEAQIQSQIAVLNEDFQRLNADRFNTPAVFLPAAADCEFEFCLATTDPSGAPTNGITRTFTTRTSFSQNDDVKFTAAGGRNGWPSSSYLNIWVCNLSSGLLGYAQFPGGPSSTDGVVVRYQSFGRTGLVQAPFDLGRTTTHEVGHWLNLRHIWGDGPCGVDDFVADTPEASGPHYGCPSSATSCGGLNMSENYMDYTNDACMNIFTQGQKVRMRALFATNGARESILSSQGCGSGPLASPYQVNQPLSSLTLGGVIGTGTTPAVTQIVAGTPVVAAFASQGIGQPWDTLISPSALAPIAAGGMLTTGGQSLNINLQVPGYYWLNSGGPTAQLRPFPGNAFATFVPAVPLTLSAQQFVLDPTSPDGFALSQGCQLVATSGACAPPFPAGPTGDDSSVTVNLTGFGCNLPVTFFGTSYTRLYVSSNGRVTFQGSDSAYAPSVNAALNGRPFVGFWTDLDVSSGGSITITSPGSGRVRVAYNNVPYYGQPSATSTFAIEFDTTNGAVILDNLLGIAPNPQLGPASSGEAQFLGMSRGAPSATNLGSTSFSPSSSGGAPTAGAMLYDFYSHVFGTGGLASSLLTPLERIVFMPAANGNYVWSGY